MSFFACFACQTKESSSSIITPIKAPLIQSLNLSTSKKTNDESITEQSRTKTVTTLTIPRSELNEDQQEIAKKVEIIKKKPVPDRKLYQSDFIRKNNLQKNIVFLIDKKWSQEYTLYLDDPSKLTMREIDNTRLLDKGHLVTGLKEKKDYFLLSQRVWIFIKKLYGGGPQVRKDFHMPGLVLSVSGIKNDLYQCYLNTGLQCLLSIPELVSYFRNKQYNNVKYDTKSKQKYFSIYTYRLTKLFDDKPAETKDIRDFAELFEQKFSKTQQHDCQQFLRYYLQQLQNELNPLKISTVLPVAKNAEQASSNYKISHPSIVDTLFAGQLSNIVKCCNCDNISITYDPFLDLSVEIGKNTLEGNLNKYFIQEKLNDLYDCERCRSRCKATKQLYISKTPQILLISLKRFTASKKKHTDNILYPYLLDLQRYCKSYSGNCEYNLQSIIVHKGSQDKGHYYCVTRRADKWYYINDEVVKEVDVKECMALEAYVLIYDRIK